jgi:hypothetical protein
VRHGLARRPGHVGVGHVALTAWADGQDAHPVVAGAAEDQPVAIHRPRHYRVALVAHPPDLPAGARVIGGDHVAARTDDLRPALDSDRQGRGEGEQVVAGHLAVGLPVHFAAFPVQGGDKLLVVAVGAENQGMVGQDRRAAAAVPRVVAELVIAPQDLAGGIQASRPAGAEMDVQPPAGDDRRGAGVAVLAVDVRPHCAVLAEDFALPEDLARLGVQAQGLEGLVGGGAVSHGHGSGQVDAPLGHHGRGPTGPRDRLLPGNVFGLAPMGRKVGGPGDPLAGGSAKLGPVFAAGWGGGRQEGRCGQGEAPAWHGWVPGKKEAASGYLDRS